MNETGQQGWIFEGEASGASPRDDLRVTPMMSQFMEIKAANPASLLFYRMGDFYELFFEDAEIASRAIARSARVWRQNVQPVWRSNTVRVGRSSVI